MSPAPLSQTKFSSETPLVNLFAYIRDLFTVAQPSFRFDQDAAHPYWSLQQLNLLSNNPHLSCQWHRPDQPILVLNRAESAPLPELPGDLRDWVEVEHSPGNQPSIQPISKRSVSFEDSAKRIQIFREFFEQVHGKPLADIQHMEVPKSIDKWIDLHNMEGTLQVSRRSSGEESFDESELRQELLIAYRRSLGQVQQDFQDQHHINAIYDALHDLHYALKAKPDQQICLSFGLLSGKIGGELYRNFLFHIPLKMSLSKQTLTLEADTLAHVITCEQSFTDLLDKHFSRESEEKIRERKLRVLTEVDQFNTRNREFNFEPNYLRGSFYDTAMKILEVFPKVKDEFFINSKLNFDLPETESNGGLNFSFSPVICTRPLGAGVQVAKDADNIIARINELGIQGKNEQIPDFFKKLFSLRRPGNPLRIAYRVENKGLSSSVSTEMNMPDRFLFPLPYNQEQLSIAQQLLKQDAVTVQGPPGTGKSHTIANLASHFVAEGKSILIVSKNAKALEVIKKKLPSEIRNLAVALLEGSQNQEELKHAIDALKNHLSQSYDPAEIDRLETEMTQLERQTEAIQSRILEQIQTNHQTLELYDPGLKRNRIASAAQWMDRFQEIDMDQLLIPDRISHNQDTSAWLTDLLREDLIDKWENESIRISPIHHLNIDAEFLDKAFLGKLNRYLELQALLRPYHNIFRHPRFNQEELAVVWTDSQQLYQEIVSGKHELLRVQVDMGELEEKDPDFLLEELQHLLSKFNSQGKLGLLKRKMLPATQQALLSCSVNQRKVGGPSDFVWIQKQLTIESKAKQLGIIMHNYLSRFGIPGKGEDVLEIYEEWDHLLANLGEREQFLQELALRNIKPELIKDASIIADLEAKRAHHELNQEMQSLLNRYQDLLPDLIAQLRQNPWQRWDGEELTKAIFARKLESFLQEVLTKLGHPNQLLSELQSIRKQKESLICELIAEKTWQRKQAEVTDRQRAALTAWRNDLINIGKGYGKNTERNMNSAVANMQLAKEVVPIWIMQQKTAISLFPDPEPGQFDLLIVDEASQCDISMLNLIFRCKKCIIVGDENQTSVATQSRLFPISRTNQLLDRYLVNHPFRQQFNINNRSASIYTLSGVIYPNIISLREHFRCRPELIGFSNQYVYDKHIIPLRTAEHDLYGQPMEVHYIEDSPEDAKKPAIVKAVIELIQTLVEDYEAEVIPELPTVGLLCLESSNEAHRELLIRELGRYPSIKRYADELQLLVGTSREFQGDERDIMILTTTASHKFDKNGQIKAPRAVMGEEMMRIYNVAASRARDKAILLHSIHPEALARMNPNCFRKRLIEYFSMTEFTQAQTRSLMRHMHPVKGQIGTAVLEWMQEQLDPSTLFPQYKVGPYAVDLAILRDGRKQALFIDGTQQENPETLSKSLQQQLVLERAGWDCIRVQALAWSLDAEKEKQELQAWLEM